MSRKIGERFADSYDWDLFPRAEKFLRKVVQDFLKRHKTVRQVANLMEMQTSTEIFDWIDHIVIPGTLVGRKQLLRLDFKRSRRRTEVGSEAFHNPSSILFPVVLSKGNNIEIVLKAESIENCVKKLGKDGDIEGNKYNAVRRATIKKEGDFVLSAVERRGNNDFITPESKDIEHYSTALLEFTRRKRDFKTDEQGMKETKRLVQKVQKKLSPARTADAFFRAERGYWQKRNRAGQIQKMRQDSLGLGWGNHDHHTYRSSRGHFKDLIAMFELMGYKCRERFYAGEKAGWGAQILEHEDCDIVLFADVDVTKDEKDQDFAHHGLSNQIELGTVGLWVGLHGESILQAGMHHLEARFDFNKLRKDLKKHGIKTMKPFSSFSFLKQAFTQGERWTVDKNRVHRLLNDGSLTVKEYHDFVMKGAIGSHLENLQRRQGYKGFNQHSVTAIIKATNPLKQLRFKRQGRGA